MRNKLVLAFFLAFVSAAAYAQGYKTERNINYRGTVQDEYAAEKCVLDVYYPEGKKGFATLVWFHGGGLEGEEKYIPRVLKERGVCVVAATHRMSPKVEHPVYIEDAAAAVAWTVRNIAKYGGDTTKVYVGGHSAGGYLALLLGLDKSYLAPYGIDPDALAGFCPISGQTMTHYTIRKELGLPKEMPYMDKYAPLAHIRKDTAPFLIVVGDRDLEMSCRTAENFYLYEALKSVGNKSVDYHELSGFDHNTVCDAALLMVLRQMGVR